MRRPEVFMACLLAALIGGCGAPSGPSGTGGPAGSGHSAETPEVTTKAVPDPEITLEFEASKNPEARELSLDMVTFLIRVKTKDPADVAVPGPPFLALKARLGGEGGKPLVARPHPLRSKPPKLFPVSLEAGESLELGPVDLGLFDLDPLEIEAGKSYELTALYQANGEAKLRKATQALVLADRDLGFPAEAPLGAAPPSRAPVALRVLDERGRPRRVFRWSPDLGFVRAEED